jgi:hypothetical protein
MYFCRIEALLLVLASSLLAGPEDAAAGRVMELLGPNPAACCTGPAAARSFERFATDASAGPVAAAPDVV